MSYGDAATSRVLRGVTLATLFALTCAAAVDERDSLRDLDGVKVVVEDVSHGLSRDQIQKDIESQLRRAGIKVLNSGEFPVGDPYLRVRVATTPERAGLVAYSVALEFAQVVFLRRDPTVTFNRAPTWKAPDRIGLVPPAKLAESIQHDLAEQVDQFIAAYYFVNPK
jgi:hypothetical protein